MSDKVTSQAITSGSDQRKNIPVVTVDSFYRAHGEKLHLKLEGKRVGFHRKIREPTINRPAWRSPVSTITSRKNGCRSSARPSNRI